MKPIDVQSEEDIGLLPVKGKIEFKTNLETKDNDQSRPRPKSSTESDDKGYTRSGLDGDQCSGKMKLGCLPKQPQSLAIVRQYMVALSASIPFGVAGSAIAWPSPTLPRILAKETPVSLDIVEISWMVSLLYVGNLISPIPASYLADKFGRRKTLLYSGLIPIVSWLLILFGTNSVCLYIARFLAGLQFGLVSTIQPIYIGEISQPEIRGTLSTLNNLMFGAGNLITVVVGPFVSYHTLAIVSFLLPLLFILTFPFMPESPYYCLMKGKTEKGRESLFWLRGDLNRIELELELDQIEKNVRTQLQKRATFRDIFSTKASRKAMTISVVFSAIKRLSGAGVIQAYATVTLPSITFKVLDPNHCVIILGVVSVLSSFLAAFVADKFGRKPLLIVSCLGCSLSMLAVGMWFCLNSKTSLDLDSTSFFPFVGFLVQTVSYNVACGPAGATVKGELFPSNVKTKSSALATITLAVTSFILNKFYLLIANWEGMYLNYLIFALSCFLGVLFTIFYVPETRGKSLQEIQDILSGVERCRVTTPVLSRTF